MASGEYKKQWHKYLPIAILNYNTTYRSSIDCEPSRVFHGRVPHNILDHKLGLRFNPNIAPTADFAEELLRRTKILYDKTKRNVMESYIENKRYFDKKSKSFTFKRKRLLLYTSAKSRPRRVNKTVPWLPLDWTLSSRKSPTEQ